MILHLNAAGFDHETDQYLADVLTTRPLAYVHLRETELKPPVGFEGLIRNDR